MGYPPEPKYMQTMTGDSTSMCPHCGMGHIGTCPRIRAIEYHSDGTVKRIEFHPMPQLVQPIDSPVNIIGNGHISISPT